MEKFNKKQSLIFVGIVALVALISVSLTLLITNSTNSKNALSTENAKTYTLDFINKNLMTGDMTATIDSVGEEYGLYKMDVNVGGQQNITSYLSKDGKLLFPQAINIEDVNKQTAETNNNNSEQANNQDIPKQEKPNVELFVMSHCPYGTQMEKGFLPVAETLGDKIDYKIRFVDYAMHGEKELKEQLNQYCIQENYPEQLPEYLTCFLESGDNSQSCIENLGLDKNKIASCVETQDNKYSVMENFKNNEEYKGNFPTFNIHKEENKKYGIQGSPGLVVNETKVSSARDPQSLLNTVCSSFEEQPEECQTELSSANPSPGFGFETSGTNSSGSGATCN